MATVPRSVPCALLLAALTVATAACGTSHSPPPQAVKLNAAAVVDPLLNQTSVSVLQHATTNTEAAPAVHVLGSGLDSGHTLTFDLSIMGSHGCTGSLKESGEGSLRLVSDGTIVWLKPDAEFWRAAAGVTDPAELARVEGKYVTATADDPNLGQLISLCKLKSLLKGFSPTSSSDAQGETKGPATRLNGQRVVKVSDTADSAYVYVTDTAQPKMLQVIDPTSGGFRLIFGYPGAASTIVPPPSGQVISGTGGA